MSYPPPEPTPPPERHPAWRRYVAELSLLLTVLIGVPGLWFGCHAIAPRAGLVATAEPVPYHLAPSAYIPVDVALAMPNPRITGSSGTFWVVRLINRGDAMAEDISVEVPGAREAVLVRGTREDSAGVTGDRVSAGSLAPGDELQVWVWAGDWIDLGTIQPNPVRVFHRTGVADAEILRPMGAGYQRARFWLTGLADVWPLTLSTAAACFMVAWTILSGPFSRRARRRREEHDPPEPIA